MDRSFLLFLCFVLAAGCVTIPTDEAACLLMPTPSVDLVTESLGMQGGDFPSKNWWEMFSDPQLNHLVSVALLDSPTLQRVQARVQQAEEEAQIKRSFLFPTVGFDANVNWQWLSPTGFFRAFAPSIPRQVTEYELGFNLFYEFDFWGKNRNLYQAELGIAQAELAEQESAVLVLTTAVALTYYKLQAQLQQLELLTEEKKVFHQLVELTRLRQLGALDTTTDTLFSEQHLLMITQVVLTAQQNVALSKNQLQMLIGQGPEEGKKIEQIALIPVVSFALPRHLSSNLLVRRPDLMTHLWRVEAMAHRVGAAKADFYPNVNLTALAGLDSIFFRKLFNWENTAASIQPALYLPIFTAGRLKANLRAKEAEFHEAIYAYNETVLHAVQEVADQMVILQTADQTLQVEEKRVENKRQNYAIVELRYQNAVNTLLQLLEAKEEWVQERYKKVESQYQRIRATIELIKALGGGYCSADQPLNLEVR